MGDLMSGNPESFGIWTIVGLYVFKFVRAEMERKNGGNPVVKAIREMARDQERGHDEIKECLGNVEQKTDDLHEWHAPVRGEQGWFDKSDKVIRAIEKLPNQIRDAIRGK